MISKTTGLLLGLGITFAAFAAGVRDYKILIIAIGAGLFTSLLEKQ